MKKTLLVFVLSLIFVLSSYKIASARNVSNLEADFCTSGETGMSVSFAQSTKGDLITRKYYLNETGVYLGYKTWNYPGGFSAYTLVADTLGEQCFKDLD